VWDLKERILVDAKILENKVEIANCRIGAGFGDDLRTVHDVDTDMVRKMMKNMGGEGTEVAGRARGRFEIHLDFHSPAAVDK
jgi:hypothetical protein